MFSQFRSWRRWATAISLCWILGAAGSLAQAEDLPDIQKRGTLRHLGVVYANFVLANGGGLDVELMEKFAKHLGVKYEYVPTDFDNCVGDLTGKIVKPKGKEVEILGDRPVKGDLIANGFTVLPWREQIVDFSEPTFPTQVWLIAKKGVLPSIKLTGNVDEDITLVKGAMKDRAILTKTNTCLAPALYNLEATGGKLTNFEGGLNQMAGEVMEGKIESTILDVPDALVALMTWPDKISVLGPVSGLQNMAVAFRKDSPLLRAEFNKFFTKLKKDGTYSKLVRKHYPAVFSFYPDFFKEKTGK